MRLMIYFAHEHLEIEVDDHRVVGARGRATTPALADPVAAVRDALEKPWGNYPLLRQALTPDDQVAVIVDERLPDLGRLLTPLLEHIGQAQVGPEAITLLCPPSGSKQRWVDDLPEAFADVRVEVHDPFQRSQLAYLATTRQGRRIYLNRTAVDADQLVVFSRCNYDPVLGFADAQAALFPGLSDAATRQELLSRSPLPRTGKQASAAHEEAVEVAWLVGAPYLLQVVEGSGDELAHVVAGVSDTAEQGRRLLEARWRVEVNELADTVVATLSGDPSRHDFSDLARALNCAARVVKPQGRIILLSRARPDLGDSGLLLRQADNPTRALDQITRRASPGLAAALQWAEAAERATIYMLSDLPAETAEELFTVPLQRPDQVLRILGNGTCLLLNDAQKTLAVPDLKGAARTER